jgi:hypothetical protein
VIFIGWTLQDRYRDAMDIETDYLIVGAGASGLAFADSLLAEADVDVVLVDRRERPGGHWTDAYPFVQLHTPSAYYGVTSTPLGQDRLIESGRNQGFYEQAGAEEICDYYEGVVDAFTSSGRARFLGGHDHVGGGRVRDLKTGDEHTVSVRRRLVDATVLESSIPATHQPSFTVAAEAAFGPINDLPEVVDLYERFTVIGAGKTSVDACLWLLDQDVSPDRIRWIRPRDMWFNDRAALQPLDQVAEIMYGLSLDAEAAAQAENVADLFDRLESSGRMLRLDPQVTPTMFRATMISRAEQAALRTIEDVVRLGRLRSIEADRLVLEQGEVPTDSGVFHVDCSALGLRAAKPVPTFGPGTITVQQVRQASPAFNAALIAFVEAHRNDDEEKNRLTPTHPYPSTIDDWGRLMSTTWATEMAWVNEPDLSAWVAGTRLNLLRAFPEHMEEPRAKEALKRFLTNVGPAIERLSAPA